MTREECFAIWAPDGVAWTPWAKPALFAHLYPLMQSQGSPEHAGDFFWVPEADGRTAIILNLPTEMSVWGALALARRGYRPVPLFNTSIGAPALVNAAPIGAALMRGADSLRSVMLPPQAPPVFLLDSLRMAPPPGKPNDFDNRWVVFRQDFPSGARLIGSGVRTALVVQPAGSLDADLEHVLFGWQEAGIHLQRAEPDGDARQGLVVSKPSGFRSVVQQLLMLAGLRRNAAGGFGARIPPPGEGGGFGGGFYGGG